MKILLTSIFSLRYLLLPFIMLSVLADDNRTYIFTGTNHWPQYEQDLESVFKQNFSGGETGYTLGWGFSLNNRWSIEVAYSEAPNVVLSLPDPDSLIWTDFKLKPKLYSMSIERQYSLFLEDTYLVSKLGFTHHRSTVIGLGSPIFPEIEPKSNLGGHILETNPDIFVGVRKRWRSLRSDSTVGYRKQFGSDFFEDLIALTWKVYLRPF